MNRFVSSIVGVATGCLVVLAATSAAANPQEAASGGQASRPAQAQGGPLMLQPVSSGMVFTPEVKFTTVNHGNGTLVGGYGGWLYDDSLLLGGAAYWLTNGENGTDMWYGGMLVGWTVPLGNVVRVGGRGLVGFGYAELPYQYTYQDYGWGHHSGSGTATTQWAWASTNFFVFEPQATATFRLTKTVSFDVAGGYRVIADANGLDRELRGGFGSVGIRFGPF
jgi:hypothetical protein